MNWVSVLEDVGKVIGAGVAIWGVLKVAVLAMRKPFKAHFEKIDRILKEVTPNGGGSLKDSVKRLETSVNEISVRQKAWLNASNEALFETDSDGAVTWVNREFCHMLRATESEILGRGWRNFFADDTQFAAWQAAVEDKRDFSACLILKANGTERVSVCVEALAIRDLKNGLLGYVANIAIQKFHERGG